MSSVRVVRTEARLTVGEWSRDVEQGQILRIDDVGGPGTIPPSVAEYLIEHDAVAACPDDEPVDLSYGPGRWVAPPVGPAPGVAVVPVRVEPPPVEEPLPPVVEPPPAPSMPEPPTEGEPVDPGPETTG